MRRINVIVLVIIVALIILTDAVVSSIRLYPTRIERKLESRAHQEKILVTNSMDDAVYCVVTMVDGGHDIDGRPVLLDSYPSELVTVCPREFILTQGESMAVEVIVSPRAAEDKRVLSPIVVFDFTPTSSMNESSVTRSSVRVGVITLLTLPGDHEVRGQIRDISVRHVDDGKMLEFAVIVDNLGDVHFRPEGYVRLVQEGLEVCRLKVETGVVLPGYARILKARWNIEEMLRGACLAQVVLTLDDGSKLTADMSFDI
jgi:hypothetical protein